MPQLLCHHGHQFDVATPTDQRVVCPLCGSVTTPKAEMHTPGSGPLDRTFVSRDPAPVEGPSSSALTHVSGQTIITEVPKPFAPTMDLPATEETPTAFAPTMDMPAIEEAPKAFAPTMDLPAPEEEPKVFAPTVEMPAIEEEPKAFAPTMVLPAPAEEPPLLPAANVGNRTVIFEAADVEASDPEHSSKDSPTAPDTNRLSESTPGSEVEEKSSSTHPRQVSQWPEENLTEKLPCPASETEAASTHGYSVATFHLRRILPIAEANSTLKECSWLHRRLTAMCCSASWRCRWSSSRRRG